jgi:hypothetical protein
MRILSRIGIPVMGAAILTAGLFAAVPQASASSPRLTSSFAVPADCTGSLGAPPVTVHMTCTDRPATQQWQLFVNCLRSGGSDEDVYGNIVTGDGTSSLRCPQNTVFVYGQLN